MSDIPIDTWDSDTFDDQLAEFLKSHAESFEKYFKEENRLKNLDPDEDRIERLKGNLFFEKFEHIQIQVSKMLHDKPIRLWHYARLIDFEVEKFYKGIDLSTPMTMKKRLHSAQEAGHLSQTEVEIIEKFSPFNTQLDIRTNRFWCVNAPISVSDSGVRPLLQHWGGEAVYFHLEDELVQQRLKTLGNARVLEISAPLRCSNLLYQISGCVLNTIALEAGFIPCSSLVDVCIKGETQKMKLLRVHTEDDDNFERIGITYPSEFEVVRQRSNRYDEQWY
mgnify:CR=1 FL=1